MDRMTTPDAEREALLESAYDAAWEAVGRNATTTDAVMLRVRQKLSVEEIRRFMGTVVPAVLRARAASQPAQGIVRHPETSRFHKAMAADLVASQPAQEPVGDVVWIGSAACVQWYGEQPRAGTKLYTAPPADTARADRIDAERYRWLRQRYDGEESVDLKETVDSYWGPKFGDELDAAIDAYIEREGA